MPLRHNAEVLGFAADGAGNGNVLDRDGLDTASYNSGWVAGSDSACETEKAGEADEDGCESNCGLKVAVG